MMPQSSTCYTSLETRNFPCLTRLFLRRRRIVCSLKNFHLVVSLGICHVFFLENSLCAPLPPQTRILRPALDVTSLTITIVGIACSAPIAIHSNIENSTWPLSISPSKPSRKNEARSPSPPRNQRTTTKVRRSLLLSLRSRSAPSHESRCPAKLQAIPSRRTIDIQDISHQIEIRKKSRTHVFTINFFKWHSSARHNSLVSTQNSCHGHTETFEAANQGESFISR